MSKTLVQYITTPPFLYHLTTVHIDRRGKPWCGGRQGAGKKKRYIPGGIEVTCRACLRAKFPSVYAK